MKKLSVIFTVLLICLFGVFALGSTESGTDNQGNGSAGGENLGKYSVTIDSCRLARDYENKPVVIVKYKFTNVSDESPAAFYIAFDDHVYQNGVGLNEAYVLASNANYNADNQTKEIKKGASIDVEVAYVLNDTTTDIEVEVSEWLSFSSKTVTKTFSIK